MKQEYPTRCQIVDANGKSWHGLEMRTPKASYPHLGKFGKAELMDNIFVKITLDDGNIIWGHECWWKPINKTIGGDNNEYKRR